MKLLQTILTFIKHILLKTLDYKPSKLCMDYKLIKNKLSLYNEN